VRTASASNVEKKAKKVEIFHYFGFFSKVEVQKMNIFACLARSKKQKNKKKIDTLWWEV
jgi:hypothetical protein